MPSPRGAQLCRLLSTSHRAGLMTLTTARQAETAFMHCFSTSARPLILSIILSCCQSWKQKTLTRVYGFGFKAFLSSRTQQVKLPNTLSIIRPCPAGVPQGCVISPPQLLPHRWQRRCNTKWTAQSSVCLQICWWLHSVYKNPKG